MTTPSKSRWALDPVVAVGMIVAVLAAWLLVEFVL
jgi:hypothetical protein